MVPISSTGGREGRFHVSSTRVLLGSGDYKDFRNETSSGQKDAKSGVGTIDSLAVTDSRKIDGLR